MKIEDYCAIKAYAEYEKNFLAHNQNNLPEFEKLNFQKRDDFISHFTIDLRKNLTTFLDHFPEDRDTVRKNLTQILKADFDNLQENNILDGSGKIDVEAFHIHLNEGVKKDLPEIYQKAQEAQQIKAQSDVHNETTNSLKENVDFSNPEETKKYFDDFYKSFANCKTREEKLKYFENGFGISLGNMSEQQQDRVISAFEMRQEIREIKENLREDFEKAHPDLSESEQEQLLEIAAVKQHCIENNRDFETEKNTNDMMIQLEEISSDIKRLQQDLLNCQDENEKEKINSELDKLKNTQNLLIETLGLSKDDIEKINENSNAQDKSIEISKSEKYVDAVKEKDNSSDSFTFEEDDLSDLFGPNIDEPEEDLSDLFDPNIDEPEENLSDLFNEKESPEIEENSNNEQPIDTTNHAFVNPILINVKEDDLKQEDYTFEVEEKESLWNKLKNGFSKIKNTIVEKLGLNKVKLLNHQKYLNTAENNTKTTEMHSENKHSFNESLIVSKEEQEKYRKEYETSKNVTQKNTSEIHTNHEQNIQL